MLSISVPAQTISVSPIIFPAVLAGFTRVHSSLLSRNVVSATTIELLNTCTVLVPSDLVIQALSLRCNLIQNESIVTSLSNCMMQGRQLVYAYVSDGMKKVSSFSLMWSILISSGGLFYESITWFGKETMSSTVGEQILLKDQAIGQS